MNNFKWFELRIYVIFFLAILLNIYSFLGWYYNFYLPSTEVLFIKEKVLITYEGEPPKLISLGMVKPLIPFILNVMIKNITLLTSLVASFFILFIVYNISKRTDKPVLNFIIGTLVFFNPLFILALAKNYIFLLEIFIIYIAFINIYIFIYIKPRSFRYLFLSAFMFGLLFLTDYRTVFILPVAVIFVILADIKKFKDKNQKLEFRRIADIISIMFVPTFFAIFLYSLVNFLLNENFSLQLFNRYLTLLYVPNPYRTDTLLLIQQILSDLIKYWYLAIPMFLFPIFTKHRAFMFSIPFVILTFLAGIYLVSGKVPEYYFIIFSLIPLISILDVRRKNLTKILVSFSLVMFIGFVFSVKNIGYKPLFEKNKELEDYRKASEVLKGTEGKILMDDGQMFPLVVFTGQTKRFVLPYQFTFIYYFSNPKAKVDYIVVNKKDSRDKVIKTYPNSIYGYMEGYYVFYQNDTVIIFKNVRDSYKYSSF